jgi:hypothetical protein
MFEIFLNLFENKKILMIFLKELFIDFFPIFMISINK